MRSGGSNKVPDHTQARLEQTMDNAQCPIAIFPISHLHTEFQHITLLADRQLFAARLLIHPKQVFFPHQYAATVNADCQRIGNTIENLRVLLSVFSLIAIQRPLQNIATPRV